MGRLFLTILLINLVPAVSVVAFGWSATSLLLVYWGENVIIGAITLAKILIAGGARGPWYAVSTLFNAAFFIVHYGLFCVVHGSLIFALTDPAGEPDPRDLFGLVLARILADPVLFWNLALLGSFHVFKFAVYWLRPGLWRGVSDLRMIMFSPYGRIIVIHVALLGGGLAAVSLGQPVIVVAALALLKSLFDAAAQYTSDDGEEDTAKTHLSSPARRA